MISLSHYLSTFFAVWQGLLLAVPDVATQLTYLLLETFLEVESEPLSVPDLQQVIV